MKKSKFSLFCMFTQIRVILFFSSVLSIHGCGNLMPADDTPADEPGSSIEVSVAAPIAKISSSRIELNLPDEQDLRAESNDPLIPCSISLRESSFRYQVTNSMPPSLSISGSENTITFTKQSELSIDPGPFSEFSNLFGRWAMDESFDSANNITYQIVLEIDGSHFRLINKCYA